ncbi:MAG: hypothetical protein ACUVX1_17135 [Chloroflexota bacterium]
MSRSRRISWWKTPVHRMVDLQREKAGNLTHAWAKSDQARFLPGYGCGRRWIRGRGSLIDRSIDRLLGISSSSGAAVLPRTRGLEWLRPRVRRR